MEYEWEKILAAIQSRKANAIVELTGISRATVYRMRRGTPPDRATLQKLIEGLSKDSAIKELIEQAKILFQWKTITDLVAEPSHEQVVNALRPLMELDKRTFPDISDAEYGSIHFWARKWMDHPYAGAVLCTHHDGHEESSGYWGAIPVTSTQFDSFLISGAPDSSLSLDATPPLGGSPTDFDVIITTVVIDKALWKNRTGAIRSLFSSMDEALWSLALRESFARRIGAHLITPNGVSLAKMLQLRQPNGSDPSLGSFVVADLRDSESRTNMMKWFEKSKRLYDAHYLERGVGKRKKRGKKNKADESETG